MAAMTGAFQQQSMGQMAYAGMIGQGAFRSMSQPMQAEGLMGGLANRAYSMGSPVLQGAMGMAGLDPFSLGMRAMGGAWGSGAGVMGAGLAGMGAMGLGAAGLAGAGFAGNQIYTGMQQQQQLNNTLRQSFNFMTPMGQGFNRSDMSQIGSTMRGMTHQFGPGGEVVGFGELTQLAAGMGKMGMGQGIRDAQEFSRKFKEMIGTLKTVATELGTTLEGAQQFLSSQRSSGIFRTADQLKFSMQARGTALSGGLALSEVTAMANIGSQISRSVGGLGRSGAFGGMRAIGQVGSAVQAGALSEEDIYNTTGLTGAEGRQALAASQLEQTGRFLKTSKGRWFMASVAGKNGQLDEESVANWMSGGMSVGDTKSQAYGNLSKVGRANFIRNEGRLRGSVMERFGGLAPAMALSQWASGRGVDINNMDDRSMLFAQRQLGMGRDEIDSAVKMAGAMPEILRQQRLSGEDDAYQQRVAQTRRGQGIEGMKRKLDQVRESVQGKLQQVGSDLFTSGSDMLEQWWNRMTGLYERRLSGDIDQLMNSARMGGRGRAEFSSALGGGGLAGGGMFSRDISSAAARIGAGVNKGDAGFAAYTQSREMQFAAQSGAAAASTQASSEFAEKSKDWIRSAYTTRLASLNSERRVTAFGNELKAKADAGDTQAMAMYDKWTKSSPSEQAGMLGAIEKQAGISDKAGLGATWQTPKTGVAQFGYATAREGDLAIGKAFLGGEEARLANQSTAGRIGFGIGSVADLFTVSRGKDGSWGLGGGFGEKLSNVMSGVENLEAGMGAYMRSREGGRLIRGIMRGDAGSMRSAEDRINELQAKAGEGGLGKLDRGEQAEFRMLAATSLGAEYAKLSAEGAPTAKVRDLEEKASKMMGRPVSEKDLKNFYALGAAAMGEQARQDVQHATERTLSSMGTRSQSLRASGVAVMKDGKLVLADAKKLGAGGQAMQLALDAANLSQQLSATTDPAEQRRILDEVYGKEGARFEAIAGMSTAEKRALARSGAGTEVGAEAGESLMREQRMKSLISTQRRAGARGAGAAEAGAIGSQLGLQFGKEELAGLGGKSAEDLAKLFAGKLGSKDEGFQKALQESIEATRGGKIGKGADLLQRAMEQADDDTKKKIQKGRSGEDPQQEMVGAIKAGNKFLEAIVNSSKASVAALNELNAKEKNNPEGG